MKKKNLTILAIIFLFVLIIGGSYAWLNITKISTSKNVITAGKLDLILGDENEGISMDSTVPMTEEKGKKQEGYTFILHNNGRIDANYTIYLDDLPLEENEKRMPDKVVKFSLERDGEEIKTGLISTLGYNPNRILDSGRIEKSSEYKYTLKVWMDDSAGNEVQNTVFYSKLRIETAQGNAEYKESDVEIKLDPDAGESILPPGEGKTGDDYTYKSLDEEIIKIDEHGNITIVGPGVVVIERTDKETGEVEKITVNVKVPLYITIGNKQISCDLVEKGQTSCVITLPDYEVEEPNKFLGWNEDPLKDKGKMPGDTIVVNKGDTIKLYPIIEKGGDSIVVNPSDPGGSVIPPGGDKTKDDYTYSSSDEDIVKVDEHGNITIVGPGDAIITRVDKETGEVEKIEINAKVPLYITIGNKQISCDLTKKGQTSCDITLPDYEVKEPDKFLGWSKDPTKNKGKMPGEIITVNKGDTIKLYPIVEKGGEPIIVNPSEPGGSVIPPGEGKKGDDYTYSSSDEEVVKVDENGNIEIVGPGTGTITRVDKETGETEKIEINAKVPVKVTVGEEEVSCDLTKKGQTSCSITLPDYETDDSHEFIGWSTDPNSHTGNKPGDKYEITKGEEQPLYPIIKKKEIKLKARFIKSGEGVLLVGSDTLSCTIPAVYNKEIQDTTCDITLPSITVDKGYSVVGWSTEQNATTGNLIGSKASISQDTTFYSISRKNEITLKVTFKLNGAGTLDDEARDVERSCVLNSVYNDEEQETSCEVELPVIKGSTNTPVVIGYNRSRDATESEFDLETTKITITENKTYYAITKSNIKTLIATFNRNGANLLDNEDIDSVERSCNIKSTYNGEKQEESCIVTSPALGGSKNTPNIIGYSTSKDNHTSSVKPNREVAITSNVTYYAQTANNKEIKYTATFELGTKVTGVAKKSDSCHVAPSYNGVKRGTTCQIVAPKVTPTHGYKSVGFSVSSESSTGETTLTLDRNMTFYANAVANNYTIEYYSNGTKVGSSSAKVDTALNLSTISSLGATKAGHTFKGWDTSATGSTVVYTDAQQVNNLSMEEGGVVKLYAVWVDDVKPTCSFGNANATYTTGSTSIDLTCTDLGVGMNSQNLSATNFTVSNGNGSITAVSTPTAVTNGYKWTLTLRGNSVGTFNITLNSGVIKDRNNNTNNASTSGNITVNGIVRTATFVRQGNGVTGIGSNTLSCTTTGSNTSCNITLPSISVNSGYTAVGWNTSNTATAGTTAGTSISLSGNPTYYAISYKNAVTRTVSWQGNGASLSGGTSSCTIAAAYNNNAQGTSCNITSPSISRTGYVIIGFNTASNATTSSWNQGVTKAINANATYYAITRKPIASEVSYNSSATGFGCSDIQCAIDKLKTSVLG